MMFYPTSTRLLNYIFSQDTISFCLRLHNAHCAPVYISSSMSEDGNGKSSEMDSIMLESMDEELCGLSTLF